MGRHFRFLPILCCLLCLAGCARWTTGSYQTIELHEEGYVRTESMDVVPVSGYADLLAVLRSMVTGHQAEATLDVSQYDGALEEEMDAAIQELRKEPIPSFAVRNIHAAYSEVGARRLSSVTVDYLRTQEQVEEIRTIWGVPALQREIANAMEAAKPAVTILMHGYSTVNMNEAAAEYYAAHLDSIMECPVIGAEIYPASGSVRILELKFRYEHTQQELLEMRREAQGMLSSAAGYVRGLKDDRMKAERLYALLRPLYQQEAVTQTPVYSLLCEGSGDSASIALVFRMLCEQAGLDCRIVEGTLNGEEHAWNLLRLDDRFYHLDIHRDKDALDLRLHYDDEMGDYDWDREEYPASLRPEPEPEPASTEPEPVSSTEPEVLPEHAQEPITEPTVDESTENTENP